MIAKAAILALLSLLTSSVSSDSYFNQSQACSSGAPFLYVTVHDEIKNVLKFSRDGCLLQSDVLKGGPLNSNSELRSIAVGTHKNNEALYVADAYTKNSGLYVYGPCDSNGYREYLDTVVTTKSNAGAVHTYGIGFDITGNVYGSFQHTDNVLRFYKDTFEAMPLPTYLTKDYPDGTFVQFGNPGTHKSSEQGVRSVFQVRDDMWIANEDINAVVIASTIDGVISMQINITDPIGLHYDIERDSVFVGSKVKTGGAVYEVDATSKEIKKKFSYSKMTHPTGVVTYMDTLFVGEQDNNLILSFNVTTGEFISVVTSTIPGVVEQIAISNC